MDETWILQRFLARDEEGLAAAYAQLGPGLTALAARIAGPETAEECVNDALLAAWQAIPPLAPVHLAAYLAKLTRNAALNRYRAQNAQKRGGSTENLSLKKRNEFLESELVTMLETQKERDDAIYVKHELLKKFEYLEAELAKERKIIKTWTNAGKDTHEVFQTDTVGLSFQVLPAAFY